jgi:hypothetical protein
MQIQQCPIKVLKTTAEESAKPNVTFLILMPKQYQVTVKLMNSLSVISPSFQHLS